MNIQIGATHELDVVSLSGQQVTLVGEAKATISPVGLDELERLDHVRAVLAKQGNEAAGAVNALFSLQGFRPNLIKTARDRSDVLLVDLSTLRGKSPPVVSPEQLQP